MSDNKLRVVIMGCGGSGGVPYAGNVWLDCDPTNPKNHRTRPSIYLEKGDTRVVIDTGPDFRTQINRVGITADQLLSGVIYTHGHMDHVMGLDDLRTFWHRGGHVPVPIHATPETFKRLKHVFDYTFEQQSEEYPQTVMPYELPDGNLTIGDLEFIHFPQIHGHMETRGFRIGDFAYSTDVNDFPEESLNKLKGLKVWVVGTMGNETGTFNHAGLVKVREWIDYLKPEMTYLTHLNAHADYDALCKIMPDHIRPAYDGMEILL